MNEKYKSIHTEFLHLNGICHNYSQQKPDVTSHQWKGKFHNQI